MLAHYLAIHMYTRSFYVDNYSGLGFLSQQNNTVQGLLITNGTKTYAVFTYKCRTLNWAGNAVIGFNAGGDYFENHPLAGLITSNLVSCVHQFDNSEWNNVIYDLVPYPDALTNEPTPPPFNSIGIHVCVCIHNTSTMVSILGKWECPYY